MLQDGPKMAPDGHGASQGRPREANTFHTPEGYQCVWHFADSLPMANGLLRPQDGPKIARESPRTGPREAQDGPKSAPRAPKNGPKRRRFGPRRRD
eukprot:4938672-Pyramimonas_sp.AAC.1